MMIPDTSLEQIARYHTDSPRTTDRQDSSRKGTLHSRRLFRSLSAQSVLKKFAIKNSRLVLDRTLLLIDSS